MYLPYAGIGSREAPDDVLAVMEKLGYSLAKKGFVLRSGAANGSDTAFEKGCDRADGKKEIYLPWKGFNDSVSNLYGVSQAARELAFDYHPNLYSLSDGAVKLMCRNGYQVLGLKLNSRSLFVICYTKDGKASGGTGQAIRIAEAYSVPVFNLHNKDNLQKLKDHVESIEKKIKEFEVQSE